MSTLVIDQRHSSNLSKTNLCPKDYPRTLKNATEIHYWSKKYNRDLWDRSKNDRSIRSISSKHNLMNSKNLLNRIKGFDRGLDDGQKLFYVICGLNVIVFWAWHFPNSGAFMRKYFTTNLSNNFFLSKKEYAILPLLLSSFSHIGPLHIVPNMYVLQSFISTPTRYWGVKTTLAVYLGGGISGSLASLIYKTLIATNYLSFGSFASILALIACTCMLQPNSRIGIPFVPNHSFSAQNAFYGLMAFDLIGLLLGWTRMDHASHLGGALFGLFYYYSYTSIKRS